MLRLQCHGGGDDSDTVSFAARSAGWQVRERDPLETPHTRLFHLSFSLVEGRENKGCIPLSRT